MNTLLSDPNFSLPISAAIGRFIRRWWLLIAAFAIVYGHTLPSLFREWWTNDDYAHGLFTPFAIAYLVYQRREQLFSIPLSPTKIGFFLVLISQLILLVGFLGAEFFLQRISVVVFLAGLILFLWGWTAFYRTAFGLILIVLAIPLPAIVFNAVALPLQLLASSMAEAVLDLIHVPVYREGNILELPNHLVLNVTEACSGIRSLVTLVALAALLTMLRESRGVPSWLRLLFVLSAIPIALVANALRVALTGLLAFNFGIAAAEGFFHSFSGALVFIFACSALLIEMLFMQKFTGFRVQAGT
jgi:exosortase